MTPAQALAVIERDGSLEELARAYQVILDADLLSVLPARYARTAVSLVVDGLCHPRTA